MNSISIVPRTSFRQEDTQDLTPVQKCVNSMQKIRQEKTQEIAFLIDEWSRLDSKFFWYNATVLLPIAGFLLPNLILGLVGIPIQTIASYVFPSTALIPSTFAIYIWPRIRKKAKRLERRYQQAVYDYSISFFQQNAHILNGNHRYCTYSENYRNFNGILYEEQEIWNRFLNRRFLQESAEFFISMNEEDELASEDTVKVCRFMQESQILEAGLYWKETKDFLPGGRPQRILCAYLGIITDSIWETNNEVNFPVHQIVQLSHAPSQPTHE